MREVAPVWQRLFKPDPCPEAELIVCAGPAFAGVDRADWRCDADPETTGSLAADPPSLHRPGETGMTPAGEGRRKEIHGDAERHRQHLLACGVD